MARGKIQNKTDYTGFNYCNWKIISCEREVQPQDKRRKPVKIYKCICKNKDSSGNECNNVEYIPETEFNLFSQQLHPCLGQIMQYHPLCRCKKCDLPNRHGVYQTNMFKIGDILFKHNIRYKIEVEASEIKSGTTLYGDSYYPLRFDFMIYDVDPSDSNKSIPSCLIEYQGEQHFIKQDNLQPEQGEFEKQQRYDRMKADYALKNNIRLEIIKYNEEAYPDKAGQPQTTLYPHQTMEDLERILKNHKIITDNKVYYNGDSLINPPYYMSKKQMIQRTRRDFLYQQSEKEHVYQQSSYKQTNKSDEKTYFEEHNIGQWNILRDQTDRQSDEEKLESLKEHSIIADYSIQTYRESLEPYYSDPIRGNNPKNRYYIKVVDTIGNQLNLIEHLIDEKIITRNILGLYDNIEFRNCHHIGSGRYTIKPDMRLADLINIATGKPYKINE